MSAFPNSLALTVNFKEDEIGTKVPTSWQSYHHALFFHNTINLNKFNSNLDYFGLDFPVNWYATSEIHRFLCNSKHFCNVRLWIKRLLCFVYYSFLIKIDMKIHMFIQANANRKILKCIARKAVKQFKMFGSFF